MYKGYITEFSSMLMDGRPYLCVYNEDFQTHQLVEVYIDEVGFYCIDPNNNRHYKADEKYHSAIAEIVNIASK